MSVEETVDRLTRRLAGIQGQLEGVRRERAEREQARALREMQDRAYTESLRKDEEKVGCEATVWEVRPDGSDVLV